MRNTKPRLVSIFLLLLWSVLFSITYGAPQHSVALHLPSFEMKILVESQGLDDPEYFEAFKKRLLQVTRDHLKDSLEENDDLLVSPYESLDDVSLGIDLFLDETMSYSMSLFHANFAGIATFSGTTEMDAELFLHAVELALSGEGYWMLLHNISTDPTLDTITSVTVTVNVYEGHEGDDDSGNSATTTVFVPLAVAMFCVLCVALAFCYGQRTKKIYKEDGKDTDSESGSSDDDDEESGSLGVYTTDSPIPTTASNGNISPLKPKGQKSSKRIRRCNSWTRQVSVAPDLVSIPEEPDAETRSLQEDMEDSMSVDSDFISWISDLTGSKVSRYDFSLNNESSVRTLDTSTSSHEIVASTLDENNGPRFGSMVVVTPDQDTASAHVIFNVDNSGDVCCVDDDKSDDADIAVLAEEGMASELVPNNNVLSLPPPQNEMLAHLDSDNSLSVSSSDDDSPDDNFGAFVEATSSGEANKDTNDSNQEINGVSNSADTNVASPNDESSKAYVGSIGNEGNLVLSVNDSLSVTSISGDVETEKETASNSDHSITEAATDDHSLSEVSNESDEGKTTPEGDDNSTRAASTDESTEKQQETASDSVDTIAISNDESLAGGTHSRKEIDVPKEFDANDTTSGDSQSDDIESTGYMSVAGSEDSDTKRLRPREEMEVPKADATEESTNVEPSRAPVESESSDDEISSEETPVPTRYEENETKTALSDDSEDTTTDNDETSTAAQSEDHTKQEESSTITMLISDMENLVTTTPKETATDVDESTQGSF